MLPVLLALVFIVLIFVIVVAGLPDQFLVSRSATIGVSAEQVFPHVNDLHEWAAWSPWAKRDPNAKQAYGGADAGPGAVMAWDGNKQIGAGRMTITESRPGELVRFRLEFLRPFRMTNTAEFDFKSSGGQTVVTWTMTGRTNFFFKLIGLFVKCDERCGKDFEQGLASLKCVVEKDAVVHAQA